MRLTCLALLVGLALGGHAQAQSLATSLKPVKQPESKANGASYLPVWNSQGKVEGLLLLDPKQLQTNDSLSRLLSRNPEVGSAAQFNWGNQTLRAGVVAEAQPTLGVFCSGRSASSDGFSTLSGCQLTQLGSKAPTFNGFNAVTQYQTGRAQVTASAGTRKTEVRAAGRDVPLSALGFGTQVQQDDIGLSGKLPVGDKAWVSIGGNLTQARVLSAAEIPGGLPSEWNTSSLKLSAGTGRVSGELVTRFTEVPGQAQAYTSTGVGVTFKTPWQGRVTVGAEELFNKGKNPLNPDAEKDKSLLKGSVPFLRYEQDL